MKDADLIVTRSGATTIAEITSIGLPAIMVPSPYVTNNHQYKNAMDLVKKDAALILEENNLTKNNFIKTVDDILDNDDEYNKINWKSIYKYSTFKVNAESSIEYSGLLSSE